MTDFNTGANVKLTLTGVLEFRDAEGNIISTAEISVPLEETEHQPEEPPCHS